MNKKVNDALNKRSDFKIYELILFGVLIMIASIFLTFLVMHEIDVHNGSNSKSISKSSDNYLSELEEVYDLINDSYYKDVDKKALTEGAIDGMLEALKDPHTMFFTKDEMESFNESMNGSYEGIGVEISIDAEGNIFVFSVFKNSPASEAGLKFNDIILSVNGKSVKGMNTTQVTALIKDDKHNKAKIRVKRNDTELEFEVEKRVVTIESVESKSYNINDKKIGYILINNFANNTYEQFKEQLESLEEDSIDGLVIDVRGNSGGYLHSVTNILDMFLPKGAIIYQTSDKKGTIKYTDETDESRNYPIAVLANEASASASEILAVSLKEAYGADVVGTYTYGKGTVQVTKDLKTGGMIKYTTQKWLSPKGKWINNVGVEPTLEVQLSETYEQNPTAENDNQLNAALNLVADK